VPAEEKPTALMQVKAGTPPAKYAVMQQQKKIINNKATAEGMRETAMIKA
jgi:hypothetical protein